MGRTLAERVEASRKRNRERGWTAEDIARARAATDRHPTQTVLEQNAAGPRWRHSDDGGPMIDAWGGPTPPRAA